MWSISRWRSRRGGGERKGEGRFNGECLRAIGTQGAEMECVSTQRRPGPLLRHAHAYELRDEA